MVGEARVREWTARICHALGREYEVEVGVNVGNVMLESVYRALKEKRREAEKEDGNVGGAVEGEGEGDEEMLMV